MLIWEALRTDDPRAHAMLASYFSERELTFPDGTARYQTVFPDPDRFVPPAGVFLVVVDDADAADVGCGGIRSVEASANGATRFEVKHLWLMPRTRGQGAGRALLAELERRAIELGAEELVLDTNASLTEAAGLYSSSGYVNIEPYNDNPNATNWYLKTLYS